MAFFRLWRIILHHFRLESYENKKTSCQSCQKKNYRNEGSLITPFTLPAGGVAE